jgi:hypothetical protein
MAGLMQLIEVGAQDIYLIGNISVLQSKQIIEWQHELISFEQSNNAICQITLDLIDISSGVCKCLQCKNIFDYSAYKQWINTNKTCPVCRNRDIEYKYYTPMIETIGLAK